ncbi:hypothetical protein ACLQ28_18130 [Micromonospora sp. DT201]|uniref:hypothetical protein n=1 Tax=Micromonospora sp. DT201 TaxID=3393442 RepID=UPI003CF74D6C
MFTFLNLPPPASAGTLMSASSPTSGLAIMIILVVLMLALFGATTWSALQQPLARNPDSHHRLTGALLALNLTAVAALITAALVI